VQGKILKRPLAGSASGEQTAIIEMPSVPLLRVLPIEKHHGAPGRFRAKSRTGSSGLLHGVWASGGRGNGDFAVGEFGFELILADEHNPATLPLALDFGPRFLVPARAGQAALETDETEFVITQRDNLSATPVIQIFALNGIVRARRFDRQIRLGLGPRGRVAFGAKEQCCFGDGP
jgi:hypothetical protein